MKINASDVLEFLSNEYNDHNHDEAGNYEAGVRFTAMSAINYVNSLVDAAERVEVSAVLADLEKQVTTDLMKGTNA